MEVDNFEYKDHTVKVYRDEDPMNPREDFENLGTMLCFHGRYNLGDYKEAKGMLPSEARAIASRRDVLALPLYLYDHSGITMSTAPFSCPWDSGQVGIIYVTKEKVRSEYGWKIITKARREKIFSYLKGEVETYDQYLTGDVYGFVIEDSEGEEVESVWGYFGMDSVREETKSIIDSRVKRLVESEG